MKKQMIIRSLLLTISLSAVLTTYGCSVDEPEDESDSQTTTALDNSNAGDSSESGAATNDVSTADAGNEATYASSDIVIDSQAVYEQYLNNEIEFDGEPFSTRYSYLKEDFDIIPAAYYYDADEDGEDELLISTFYYGFDIFDVRDGELVLLDYGDGTSDTCSVFSGEDHTYVAHSDFLHEGRQVLTLIRYDEKGDVVELISLSANYEDSESGTYDENSQFSYNDTAITMAEYEEYMLLYQAVPVEDMKEAEIDESLFE